MVVSRQVPTRSVRTSPGRPDLLAVAPARRWLGVEDLPVVYGGEDRADDLVDPLGFGVVDAERAAAGGRASSCAASEISGGSAGWLGWTNAASSSSESTGACGSSVHWRAASTRIGWVGGRDRFAAGRHLDHDLRAGLLLDPGEVGRVEPDRGLLDRERLTGLHPLDEVLPRPAEHRAERVHHADRESTCSSGSVDVHHQPVEERQPVVGHRVIDLRRGQTSIVTRAGMRTTLFRRTRLALLDKWARIDAATRRVNLSPAPTFRGELTTAASGAGAGGTLDRRRRRRRATGSEEVGTWHSGTRGGSR